jgi:5-methylcytosine-specific restriction endonuclease McrA
LRSNRKLLEKELNSFYSVEYYGNPYECAYCGEPRECLDHVPPLSLVSKLGMKVIRENNIELIKVPACSKCNLTLGSRRLATYADRLVFLYERLSRDLSTKVLWTKEEIEQLSGNLKQMVKNSQLKIQRDIINRLAVMQNNLMDKKKTGYE